MVIPIRDENPTRRRAVVTLALIAINLIVYFGMQLPKESRPSDVIRGATAADDFAYRYAVIPCELTEGRPLDVAQFVTQECAPEITTNDPVAEQEIYPGKNVWLAALYSMFLHGSLLHVLGNMLFLWVFGNNVEDRFGPVRFLVFYLVTGLAATAAHVAFNTGSTVPMIGASGAIAGVMGAYIVWWPRARVLSLVPVLFFFGFFELPAAVVLGIWFGMQFLTNPNEGIAWLAHVGGFTAGAAIAFALRNVLAPPFPGPSRPRRNWGRHDDDGWDPGFGGGYRGRQ